MVRVAKTKPAYEARPDGGKSPKMDFSPRPKPANPAKLASARKLPPFLMRFD